MRHVRREIKAPRVDTAKLKVDQPEPPRVAVPVDIGVREIVVAVAARGQLRMPIKVAPEISKLAGNALEVDGAHTRDE